MGFGLIILFVIDVIILVYMMVMELIGLVKDLWRFPRHSKRDNDDDPDIGGWIDRLKL